MKRFIAVLIACMLLLSGCGGKNPPPVEDPPEIPSRETAEESMALDTFRAGITDREAQIAVAYLGYVELMGYNDLTVYLEANGFYERYPFLPEMTEEQFLQREGGELYLVVPVSGETVLSVFDCAVDETDYELARGEQLLCLEAGQPLLLQGNVSEIVPNLWVCARREGEEPLDYVPCISLMDGTLEGAEGVYDSSDYDHVLSIWQGTDGETPMFCGTWHSRAVDGTGNLSSMELILWPDGYAAYSYGAPESDVLESFEGTWQETDGILTLELRGGPVGYDGNHMPQYTYDTVCSFDWDYQSRHLYLRHTEGGTLLYKTEGETFDFLPFDAWLLAGKWSVSSDVRDWVYDLSLLENGECFFVISGFEEEPAWYEGWWSMTEDGYVSLDLGLSSGRHPENPEMEYISGTYLAEKNGSTLDLAFASGGILTLGMEEHGRESFTLVPDSSCVSVHYASDVSVNWEECDHVIVDDTLPLEVALCTMVPVENVTVVSLFLQGDGDNMTFDVTELFEYGTLTPERPLRVTMTSYGDIPSYGVSFTDPNGVERLFGINISGMDGSLEWTEIR